LKKGGNIFNDSDEFDKAATGKKTVCNFRFTNSVTTSDNCGCDYNLPSTKRTLYQMVESSNCKRGKIQSKG